MQLVLEELQNIDDPEEREFVNLAVWNPETDSEVPPELLALYPPEMWEERPPKEFVDRINGPYAMLTTHPDDADIETVETDLTREDVLEGRERRSQPEQD